jgi:hypothetical protein
MFLFHLEKEKRHFLLFESFSASHFSKIFAGIQLSNNIQIKNSQQTVQVVLCLKHPAVVWNKTRFDSNVAWCARLQIAKNRTICSGRKRFITVNPCLFQSFLF